MIDTVTIRVPLGELLPGMNRRQELQWLEEWDTRTNHGYKTWVRNPSPHERKTGNYYPLLTAYKERTHNWRPFVKIQFSAAKLFWGNNLNELENHHAIPVSKALQQSLVRMGLKPNREALLRAEVASLHYSKNIVLGNGYTTAEVIQDISRIQSGGRLQKRNSQYYKGGLGTNLYNNSFSFSVYDKIAEIKHETPELLVQLESSLAVMRLEVRLETKQKINHVFSELDLGQNPTFQEVFDVEKSRQVVTHCWQKLIAPQIVLVSQTGESANSIIQKLLRGLPDATLHKAIKVASLVLSGRAAGGLSELRTIVLNHGKQRTWYRLYKEIKEASQILEAEETGWWEQVETQLAEYEALSLIENYQML